MNFYILIENGIVRMFAVLGDGKPEMHGQIVRATGLGESAAWAVLIYYWKKGFILRTDKPIREYERFF